MTSDLTPAHEHDCGPEFGCHYLGRSTDPAHADAPGCSVVDLWLHTYPDAQRWPSLIVRYSSQDSDYQSAPVNLRPPTGAVERAESLLPGFGEVARRALADPVVAALVSGPA